MYVSQYFSMNIRFVNLVYTFLSTKLKCIFEHDKNEISTLRIAHPISNLNFNLLFYYLNYHLKIKVYFIHLLRIFNFNSYFISMIEFTLKNFLISIELFK